MTAPQAFLPEIFLLAGTLLTFLMDALGVRRREPLGAIALAVLGGSILLVLSDLGFPGMGPLMTLASGPGRFPSGALIGFWTLGLDFQLIVLLSAFLVGLGSLSRPNRERGAAVFYGLLLLATLGMLLVLISADLIFLLLALEVVAFTSYLLVGYPRREARPLEAAMKFYIIGALSTALSFFGASLLYGAFGTTSLYALGHSANLLPGRSAPELALAGYAFLLVGLGFKVTAVPFQMWAVDVYDGAPDEVSAFLAGGTKKVGVFAYFVVFLAPLLFLTDRFLGGPPAWTTLSVGLGALAVLTMTVGNVLALMQDRVKRLLAYSSISQAGYMLIGIAVGSSAAIAGATLQVFAHVLMKTGAFIVVAAVFSLGIGPKISDWRGLGARRPWLSAGFAVMLLGLAGIPLTVGFVSKFILFSSAVEAQSWYVWLAVAGLLNSALSVFYYARLLKAMYLDQPEVIETVPAGSVVGAASSDDLAGLRIGYGRAAAIAIAVVLIFVFGVYPQPVFSAFQAGAEQLIQLGV